MSSREIAELTGKRHDNVMADIRTMLGEFGEPALKFQGCYIGGNGKSLPLFRLHKRETMILVSGYSIMLRARIVDRWQELEALRPQFPYRHYPLVLRNLLLASAERDVKPRCWRSQQ